ncbi:MAG: DMT family transporter [Chloroflexi bacterium]|nr:DMT family transporter [Chloroflexota bacterium]
MKLSPEARSRLWDLSLVYCAVVWGSTFFLTRQALSDVHPVTLVAYRFILAGLLSLPVALFFRMKLLENIRDGLLLGSILWILYFSQTVGLKYTTAGNSGFITGLFVLFVPLFNWFLWKRKPSASQVIAVIVALSGLWLLTGGVKGANAGDIITLFSAVTYALHVLLTDKIVRKGVNILTLSIQQFLLVGLVSFVVIGIFNIPLRVSSVFAAGVILYLTIFPTLSAFFLQCFAQRLVNPIKVSLIFTLEPVFAAVFAWTIGGEKMIPASAVGGGLIVAAMIISELPGLKLRLNNNKNANGTGV